MPEAEKIDAQLKSIARMLVEARAPLIYGLTQLTVEAQELAVELAMCLRGAIDTPRGSRIPARGTSLQLHGEARTTQGELHRYADLLVFVELGLKGRVARFLRDYHLLHNEKHIVFRVQLDRPAMVNVKVGGNHVYLGLSDFESKIHELGTSNIVQLQAVRNKLRNKSTLDQNWEALLLAWHSAKYPVLVYNPNCLAQLYGLRNAAWIIEQLEQAVLNRSAHGRAAAWPVEVFDGQLSNAAGADYVLTARTGYPVAAQCFSGCAEYLPGVTNAEALLADGVIDAALFLGEGPSANWTAAALQHLQNIPTAILASKEVLHGNASNRQIECSSLSEEQGTIVREDGIPLPLRPAAPPVASTEKYLRQLLTLIRELATTAPGAAR